MTKRLMLIAMLLAVSAYAGTWHKIMEVKGTASKQTDIFETVGSKWRIRWQKPASDSKLSITIYDTDGKAVDLIATKQSTEDESYVHKAGKFYLSLNASDGYVIIVEDWR